MSAAKYADDLVLDVFSGYGSATEPFVECGHHRVLTIDSNPECYPSIVADVRLLPRWLMHARPSFVWLSPPCTAFSYARQIWAKRPDAKVAAEGISAVEAALLAVRQWSPRHWLLENPRGHLQDLLGPPLFETNWCAWGKRYRKPTQFWGDFPRKLGQPCRHSRHAQRITFRQEPLKPHQRLRALRSRRVTRSTVFEVATRDPTRRGEIPRAFAVEVHRSVCAFAEPHPSSPLEDVLAA